MKPREAKVVQAAQEYYSSLNDTEIEAMGATEEIVWRICMGIRHGRQRSIS